MRIFLIHKSELDTYWPKLEPEFDRVVDKAVHDEFSTANIRELVENDAAQLAAVVDGNGDILLAIAFEFRSYPSGKFAVNVFATGGRDLINVMRETFPEFQDWCREFGADWIECSVSDGMERMHLRSGFETVYKQMRFYL